MLSVQSPLSTVSPLYKVLLGYLLLWILFTARMTFMLGCTHEFCSIFTSIGWIAITFEFNDLHMFC